PRLGTRAGAPPRNHRGPGERSRVVTPRFPSGVDRGARRARLESPRDRYATPGVRIGTTRALRRRQLPTKRCHAALLFGATRAYQPDSSSKPLPRQPRAGVLGNLLTLTRTMLGGQPRPRDRRRRYKLLDSRSFHISGCRLLASFRRDDRETGAQRATPLPSSRAP